MILLANFFLKRDFNKYVIVFLSFKPRYEPQLGIINLQIKKLKYRLNDFAVKIG